MQTHNITKIVIAGGGTSGWMAAAALAKLLSKNLDICLVESNTIGRIGVGEATIPQLRYFNKLLGIDERDFMHRCQATFKLGIEFNHWGRKDHKYIHSFGSTGKACWACDFQHFWLGGLTYSINDPFADYCLESRAAQAGKMLGSDKSGINYAYHLDTGLFGNYLKQIAIKHGVKHIEGKITEIQTHHSTGSISALHLDNGQHICADLFIDCTGFAALLIEGAMHTGFEDYGHVLPCNAAVAIQTEPFGPPPPYTQAIAHDIGWQWRIPLQHRVGNGLVYCNQYASADRALELLSSQLQSRAITEARAFTYRTGRRLKAWNKNCVAIGLAGGFMEPLESTSIHLAMSSILRLMRLFPKQQITDSTVDEFNQETQEEMERIRDFLVLHYIATDRRDCAFWRHCQQIEIPKTLQSKIDLFRQSGCITLKGTELFRIDSWAQVMLGQGIMPQTYHPIVHQMSEHELKGFLSKIKFTVQESVERMPNHQQFIDQYCKSD